MPGCASALRCNGSRLRRVPSTVAPDQCVLKAWMDSALFPEWVSRSTAYSPLISSISTRSIGSRSWLRLVTLDNKPERLPVLDGGGCIFDVPAGKATKIPRLSPGFMPVTTVCEEVNAGAVGSRDPHDAERGTVHNHGFPVVAPRSRARARCSGQGLKPCAAMPVSGGEGTVHLYERAECGVYLGASVAVFLRWCS